MLQKNVFGFRENNGLTRDVPPRPRSPRRDVSQELYANRSWRPTTLSEMVGQKAVRQRLQVMAQASLLRGAALPHMIFYGPKGSGKTTLARAMARERGVRIIETTGDTLFEKRDVRRLLNMTCANGWAEVPGEGWLPYEASAGEPVILFVDEIHRASKEAAESLYHPLEDGTTSVETRQGVSTMVLPPFTLVGATTDAGKLLTPLVTRMRMLYLEPYSDAELVEIARAHASRMSHEPDLEAGHMTSQKITWGDSALAEIAVRSQGVPRLIVQNLREVYDLALVTGVARITLPWTQEVMTELLGIDAHGFSPMDRRLLKRLAEAGKPVGLRVLGDMLGESEENVRASERYLTEIGAILRTPRGRQITTGGRAMCPALDTAESDRLGGLTCDNGG